MKTRRPIVLSITIKDLNNLSWTSYLYVSNQLLSWKWLNTPQVLKLFTHLPSATLYSYLTKLIFEWKVAAKIKDWILFYATFLGGHIPTSTSSFRMVCISSSDIGLWCSDVNYSATYFDMWQFLAPYERRILDPPPKSVQNSKYVQNSIERLC